MQLSGWHRLGIVASGAWIGYWAVTGAQDASLGSDWQLSVIVAAIYALVPVALAWIFCWTALWLARWVWRGFVPLRRHVDQ